MDENKLERKLNLEGKYLSIRIDAAKALGLFFEALTKGAQAVDINLSLHDKKGNLQSPDFSNYFAGAWINESRRDDSLQSKN